MSRENEATVEQFLALFDVDDPDFARMMTFLSADARYLSRVRHAEPFCGRTVIEAELRSQFSRYRDCRCSLNAIVSNASQVFTERGDTVTMRRDGRRVTVLVAGLFDFNQAGEITYWREYWDLADVMAQMDGPLP